MSRAGETAAKTTGPKKPRKIPQPHGGALNSGGTPGNRGGRPPEEFKRRMREIASSDEALAYLEECIRGEHGPKAAAAARAYATDRGYGKAAQPVEHSGKQEFEVRIVRE